MGGLDGTEPPSKCVKGFSVELQSISNKSSLQGPIVPLGGPMARSLPSLEKKDMVGSKGVIKKVATLWRLGLSEDILKSASFLIWEYKFFNLLLKDKVMDALKTLRTEIAPLKINKKRLHELSSCGISLSRISLLGFAGIDVDSGKLRLKLLDELHKLLPPSIVIPDRPSTISVEKTKYHKKHSRMNTIKVLHGHHNEVWCLQFSHNGKYLASSSNDRSVIIWEVQEDAEVSLKHTLNGHQKPVVKVSWSPDDRFLLSCGMEEAVRCWDVHLGVCLRVYEKSFLGLISCIWVPDGKQFFSGATDRSISLWDLEGNEVECWKGQRTTMNSDMAVMKNGRQIITMCREKTILLLDWESKLEKLIEENQIITSFSLSRDEKFLLINLLNQEIHLWSIADDPEFIRKYEGHKRSRFVIRSCLGGFEEAFVASGSEDSQVYIWHRKAGSLIEALPGHSGAVKCVSWSPTNPHMLASGSDDRTIRIWGPKRPSLKRKDTLSNGSIRQCNGTCK